MPSGRAVTAGAGNEYLTTWTLDATSINAWKTNNSSAGPTHAWWAAARAFSTVVDEWHTFYATGTNADKLTVGNAAFVESEI